MKPFEACARWILNYQQLRSCVQLSATAPVEYFFHRFVRNVLTRLRGRQARLSQGTRRIHDANVGKVKPANLKGAHGGVSGNPESLVARIARRYGHRDTQAATLSRQAVQRILALRQCVPLLGLAGVCLVNRPTLITPDEELEGVCVEIRNIVDKINFDVSNQIQLGLPVDRPVALKDFELGDPIAKGCNAVVYAAKYAPKNVTIKPIKEEDELIDEVAGSPPLSSSPPLKFAEEFESPAGSVDIPIEIESENMNSLDLAVKMMFNYDAESNAAAIWSSLSRECAPAANNQFTQTKDAYLPSHPCIVDVKVAFADRVPLLRGAKQMYPHALPPRLNDQGIGRNATMFLVMKRYHTSLRGYLRKLTSDKTELSDRAKLSLCAQLFESIAHLVEHGVAHRDLKSDNVLVEIGASPLETQLALTDFGCCLIPSDCLAPLKLAFTSGQVSKGGNVALMAPEIQMATPGLLNFIDYSRSDLWSAATLVYEIYGQANPFYEGKLLAKTYDDKDLPDLIGAPATVQALVKQCLKRDPAQRPSPELAATIFQLLLHAPQQLTKHHSAQQVVQWLCDLAVDALFATRKEESNGRRSSNQLLRRLFLARVHLKTVLEGLVYIRNAEQQEDLQKANTDATEHASEQEDGVGYTESNEYSKIAALVD